MRFSFDPARLPMTYQSASNGTPTNILFSGERLRSLVASRADGGQDLVVEDGRLAGDPARTFRLVTLAFMVAGGDRYFPLTQGTDPTNLVSTDGPVVFGTDGAEQKALADYLRAAGLWRDPDVSADLDDRIQRLNARADTVLRPELAEASLAGGMLRLTFGTLPDKWYAPASAPAVGGTWEPMPPQFWRAGDGFGKSIEIPAGSSSRFFRIQMDP